MTLEPTAEQVCDTYALGVPRGSMTLAAQGEQGLIWRLETDSGIFAVKQLVIRQTESERQVEIQLQEAASRCRSFVLPGTVRTTDGAVLAELGSWQVRVQTWVDLHELDVGLDPERIGTILAELHLAGAPTTEQVHPWYTEPVGARQWQHYLDELQRVQAPVAAVLAEAMPRLLALEELIVEPTNLRVCHRDLWADNVRTTPSGEICIIDWDNCGAADPSHELAMVMWEFGADDDHRCQALYDRYRGAGGPATISDPGALTMVIAQFGHFYASAFDVWIEPNPTPDDLAWSQGRLDELASRPLTLATINQLVSAVT